MLYSHVKYETKKIVNKLRVTSIFNSLFYGFPAVNPLYTTEEEREAEVEEEEMRRRRKLSRCSWDVYMDVVVWIFTDDFCKSVI